MSSSSTKRKTSEDDQETTTSPIKKLEVDEENEDCDDEPIVLPYDVLRIIFADLLAKDLSNSAMTCRLWREVAAKELKRRQIIAGLTTYDVTFQDCHKETHFHNVLANKPMLGIFMNSYDREPPACLTSHLPRSCISVSILNKGVVMNNVETEVCHNTVAYAFLPDDPAVNIEFLVATPSEMIHLNRKMKKLKARPHRMSFIEPMINDTLKRLKDIKCMIFLTSDRFTHTKQLCELKVFKQHVKVAWGGATEQVFVHQAGRAETKNIRWLALMISGKSVKSWSTVIDEDDEEVDVHEKLSKLKKEMKLQKHTIGFIFSCVARGSEWYNGKKNVESTIFKEIFPQIPLIGSFGNGEYGIDSEDPNPYNYGLYHQYCSSFMILTYG